MKKNIFAALLILLSSISVIAQESITSYDGRNLNKGDELTIGYHGITSSYYNNIKEKIITEYGREQYPNIKEDMTYSKVRIIDFITPEKPTIFPNKNLVVVAKDATSNKDLYIEIDKAIEKGEIVSEMTEPIYKDAVFLSDDLLMACVIRVNKIPVTDDVLLSFIGTKDKGLQKRCYADEFELNKAKPQYTELLNKLMDEFDFSAVYYIKNGFQMDKYDFIAGGYPLSILTEDNTFISYGYNGVYNFIVKQNREKYRLLSVAPEKAEMANKRRKGTSNIGYISPNVFGKFYFKHTFWIPSRLVGMSVTPAASNMSLL